MNANLTRRRNYVASYFSNAIGVVALLLARSVTEGDLSQYKAKFGNPTIFVSLVEWADRVITE